MVPTKTTKQHTYVIAEIGACHDGDARKMFKSIDAASYVGADAIKFQWASSGEALARRRGRALQDGYAEIYDRYLAWDPNLHRDLSDRCANVGIDYMCTCYLADDIGVVAPYVRKFKVSSFESQDVAFIGAHEEFNWPVYVSFGMSTDDQVLTVRELLPDMDIRLMHCVSSYPAPTDALNLSVFHALDIHWDGFSDHSDPGETMTGALAVAAGASTVEAHMRLDDTLVGNPDYPHAMDTIQFAVYVSNIRYAERAMGDSEKSIQACESEMRKYQVEV